MPGRGIKTAILLLTCWGSITDCHNSVPVKESLDQLNHHRDHHGDKATDHGDKTTERTEGIRGSDSGRNEGKDTPLLSLKATRMVALEAVIGQVWKFEDADKAHWNAIFWDTVINTRQYPELALFPDHSATVNPRCGLKMGKWRLEKERRELALRFADGTSAIYTVREIALKQMVLSQGSAIIRLTTEALVHKHLAEDPYYPANSLWRIKPGKPETREEIRERVKACLHFYSLFFLDNHQREETDISFSGLPSCFIWYNGGIGVQERSALDAKWINCFYSTYQAYQGYDMIASLLASHKLVWPEHPTSWVKQTGEVLEQMVHKL